GNAEGETEADFGDLTEAAWTEPVHDDQPKGNHGHEQRRYSRRNDLFDRTDAAIADKHEQTTSHDGRFPVRACGPDACFPAQDGIKERSNGKVAKAGEHQRRNRLDANADG